MKNIQIADELHRRIKVHAVLHGTTIKDWTEQVLSDALDSKWLVDTQADYNVKETHDE